MAQLKPLPFREVARRLQIVGYTEAGQRGSHVKFVRQDDHGLRVAIVPNHREIAIGTLRSIIRQAGLTPEAFADL